MITGFYGSQQPTVYTSMTVTVLSLTGTAGNPNSMADDTIMALYKDRDGSLWIGSRFGGLDRLDPSRDTLHALSP